MAMRIHVYVKRILRCFVLPDWEPLRPTRTPVAHCLSVLNSYQKALLLSDE